MAGKPTDEPAWSRRTSRRCTRSWSPGTGTWSSPASSSTPGLAAPVHTRRIQLQNGVPVVTDGPYPETQEVLAGYTIVECDSFDRATEIAARAGERPTRPARRRIRGRRATDRRGRRRPGRLTRAVTADVEDLLRRLAPQVLGAVVRRYGHFDTAEDAVQEALLAAAIQWPARWRPDNPRAWLITVASRRLTDLLRSEQARQRREDTVAHWTLPDAVARARRRPVRPDVGRHAHPAVHVLPPGTVAGVADRAHAAGGRRLTTAEVARAFLVPEATMTRRISRAKQRIKDSGLPFAMPPAAERVRSARFASSTCST